jgi:hypothetical protein
MPENLIKRGNGTDADVAAELMDGVWAKAEKAKTEKPITKAAHV